MKGIFAYMNGLNVGKYSMEHMGFLILTVEFCLFCVLILFHCQLVDQGGVVDLFFQAETGVIHVWQANMCLEDQ